MRYPIHDYQLGGSFHLMTSLCASIHSNPSQPDRAFSLRRLSEVGLFLGWNRPTRKLVANRRGAGSKILLCRNCGGPVLLPLFTSNWIRCPAFPRPTLYIPLLEGNRAH